MLKFHLILQIVFTYKSFLRTIVFTKTAAWARSIYLAALTPLTYKILPSDI